MNDTLLEDDPLAAMTAAVWARLSHAERERVRDYSQLSPQLCGLEGWRVEVETDYGETRRFIVGRSTGWRPIHLEIARRDSSGGGGAERHYRRVTRLYQAR